MHLYKIIVKNALDHCKLTSEQSFMLELSVLPNLIAYKRDFRPDFPYCLNQIAVQFIAGTSEVPNPLCDMNYQRCRPEGISTLPI